MNSLLLSLVLLFAVVFGQINYSTIRSKYNNKCLDSVKGTNEVILYSCHAGNNQKWFYNSASSQILNGYNGKCLDASLSAVQNNDPKPIVLTYSCHDGTNQKWYIDGDKIKSKYNNKCLDYVVGDNKLILFDCHNGNNQKWDF